MGTAPGSAWRPAAPRDERGLGGAWTRYQQHAWLAPASDLEAWVDRLWTVAWDYETPYEQPVLPYPQVHLTFSAGRATVCGVASRFQVKVLARSGGVLGVAFRPGCFRPFLGAPVSSLRDRVLDAADVLGAAPPVLPGRPSAADVPAVEAFLAGLAPAADPLAAQAAEIVARIAGSTGLTRVELSPGTPGPASAPCSGCSPTTSASDRSGCCAATGSTR